MKVSEAEMLDMLLKIGGLRRYAAAERALPDPVDLEGDAKLLAGYGLEQGQLLERFSNGP